MPEFYDLENENGLEVYEGDLNPVETFSVTEDYADDALSALREGLNEDEPAVDGDEDLVVYDDMDQQYAQDTIPGSDAKYEEYNADDQKDSQPQDPNEKPNDPAKFIDWLLYMLTKIPRHSGNTIPGCERAVAYIKFLDNEASKAMRTDYEGKIDEIKLDAIRKDMRNMTDRLENQIERLRKTAGAQKVRIISNAHCDGCNSTAPMWEDPITKESACMNCEQTHGIEKTAATPKLNVYMTPFERAVVGTIINAKVSGGRNIEEVYERLKNKYNFTPREELAFQQLIMDHGYSVYKDRGLLNEPTDPTSGDNVEWQTNYHA